MPSLLPGYEYDVFISYRQNDNRSGWVTQFVEDLREELGATLKDQVNIYFDENPHDGLQDTHLVDESLKGKLRCLVFVPILSRTYCDPKGFAWNHEFTPFCTTANEDALGFVVRLSNGNAASRVLPVLIHDVDPRDRQLFEEISGSVLRPLDFVFRSSGVNRPLTPGDERGENQSRTIYRDQINKTANALEEILQSIVDADLPMEIPVGSKSSSERVVLPGTILSELKRRNVFRAGITYVLLALLAFQILSLVTPILKIEERFILLASRVMVIGFPLALFLAWMFEVSPQGFVRTTSNQSRSNPFPPSRKKPLTSTSMLIVLVGALGLLALYARIILQDGGDTSPLSPIAVAVLPFENRGSRPEDQHMADGLTEDIIAKLGTLPQLRVTNRKSTQKYQGDLIPSLEVVGGELNVEKILFGHLVKSGDKVTITAHLVNASNNRFIWGNTFNRSIRNYMSVDGEIALAVSKHLNISLTDQMRSYISHQLTNNDSAYYHYTLGRNLYYKYKKNSNDSAITEFKMAIEADPRYALAWAGLGDAFSQVYTFRNEYDWLDSALAAGQHAIDLDSSLSEGYKAMANAYNYKKIYDKAFPLLKKAVELSPSNASAVGNLGTAYFFRAELVEALQFEMRSAGITPGNWIAYYMIGWIYGLLGDRDRAIESLTKSIELNPYGQTYEILAYNYVAQGRKRDALKLIPTLLDLGSEDYKVLERAGLIAHFSGEAAMARDYFQKSILNNKNYKNDLNTTAPIGLGQILLDDGKRVEANVLLTHALEINLEEFNRGSQDDETPFRIAAIYAIRGQKEEMLEWLNKAIAANWIDHTLLSYGPWFIHFRDDKQVQQLLEPVKKKLTAMRQKVQ